MRVSDLFDVSHTLRVDVLLGASGEAIDKCEIALLHACSRDSEVFLRLVWDIVLRVWGRVVVLVRIDSEHGEVTCVTRPHPVVGVSSELSDG